MFTKDYSIKSKNKKKLYIFSIFPSEMVNYHLNVLLICSKNWKIIDPFKCPPPNVAVKYLNTLFVSLFL